MTFLDDNNILLMSVVRFEPTTPDQPVLAFILRLAHRLNRSANENLGVDILGFSCHGSTDEWGVFLHNHMTFLTPHKVRKKEHQMSWIGCGLVSMHVYVGELKGLCKARIQVRSICVDKHS